MICAESKLYGDKTALSMCTLAEYLCYDMTIADHAPILYLVNRNVPHKS